MNLQLADLNILIGVRGMIATFDVAPGFAIHIMSIRDVALDWPIRAQDDPEFPPVHMCTAQNRTNDWNVILSADRACIKPVKCHLSRRTNRSCCGRAEGANKIFLGRHTWCDLVDLDLCDRFTRLRLAR